MNISPGVRYRLYQNNFQSSSSSRPLTAVERPSGASVQPLEWVTEGANSFVRSTGPWWADPNHSSPGPGWLHLIAYDYFRSYLGPSGVIGGERQDIDLTDATYSFRVRLDDLVLPPGASLVFWFQARDPSIPVEEGQYVNYMYTALRIEEVAQPGEWTTITIHLTDDDSDWVALGSAGFREGTYSVSESIAHALSSALPADAGIIMMLGNGTLQPATGSISFDDFQFIAPNATPDVVYDGLLWNPATGQVSWYDAYGTGGSAIKAIGAATTNWHPISVKYFAPGDTQIVWREASSSQIGYWNIVDGARSGGYVNIGHAQKSWVLQAPADSADLDGNGYDDFVWRDSQTGQVITWLMNNGRVAETHVTGSAGLDWHIVGTGDVTGDGVDDLIWFSPDEGRAIYWEIQNGEKVGPDHDLDRSSTEEVIGVGDFRGDGFIDILWRDEETGALSYTNAVDSGVEGRHYLGELDAGWDVAAIRDVNGDGKADLILRHPQTDAGSSGAELENRHATTITSLGDGAYRVQKTGGSANLFDASATSQLAFEGDFKLSAESLSGMADFFIGMDWNPTADNGSRYIDWSVQIYSNGRGYIVENEQHKTTFVIDGTVWIWREGTTLKYGTGPDFETASTTGLVRTVNDVTDTLYFDSSFKSMTSDVQIKLEGTASYASLYWAVDDQSLFSAVSEDSPLWHGLAENSDLDGNGTDDLISRAADGVVSVTLRDENGAVTLTKTVGAATLDWQMVGSGEVNGDGTDDLLWFSAKEGQAGYWYVQDGVKVGPYRVLDRGSTGEVIGVGDFRGDGFVDLLWRDNATGRLSYSNLANGSKEGSYLIGDLDPGREVVGIGDFRGDGFDDILWRDTETGALGYINIVGGSEEGSYLLGELDSVWDVAGVGDIDGDGIADLLLRNSETDEMVSWIVDPVPYGAVEGGILPTGFDFVI